MSRPARRPGAYTAFNGLRVGTVVVDEVVWTRAHDSEEWLSADECAPRGHVPIRPVVSWGEPVPTGMFYRTCLCGARIIRLGFADKVWAGY